MQKITPFLWFDGKAEDAARFYTSIFTNSKIESVTPMSATFQLDVLEFIAKKLPSILYIGKRAFRA